MAYFFVYFVIWMLSCVLGAINWDEYDPKNSMQTFTIVIMCFFWPIIALAFFVQEFTTWYDKRC